MDWTYLDNNATTQPLPEVVQAVEQALRELWANPSSVHRFGQMARQRVELARSSVARLLGCREREVIFTSGGTESNNLALGGILQPSPGSPALPGVLVTTKIEHSAIREPTDALGKRGVEVVHVPVDSQGRVTPVALRDALAILAGRDATVLVSIQWANNETGVIQPVAALADVVRQFRESSSGRVYFHVDGTQAVGKIPVDVKAAGVDLLSFAGHKFHGPKGVGGLYLRTGVRLRPQVLGGPQERERRGGTENTPGIIGLGVAAEAALAFVQDAARIEQLRAMRDRFESQVCSALADLGVTVNSGRVEPHERLWNTTNLGFPQLEAEAILLALSERGVCASAGAACSSGSLEPSPVLLAMGIPETIAHGSVRFSLSRFTADAEIDRAVEAVVEVVRKLSRTLPVG